jgi:hypothetical protein
MSLKKREGKQQWLVSDHHPRLVGLRNRAENPLDSRLQGRDLKPGPPEYKVITHMFGAVYKCRFTACKLWESTVWYKITLQLLRRPSLSIANSYPPVQKPSLYKPVFYAPVNNGQFPTQHAASNPKPYKFYKVYFWNEKSTIPILRTYIRSQLQWTEQASNATYTLHWQKQNRKRTETKVKLLSTHTFDKTPTVSRCFSCRFCPYSAESWS